MVSQLYLAADSIAGPPLVVDDPGILDPGAWEIILGYSIEDRPVGKLTRAPSLDVSLGISPNSQLSFFLPRSVVEEDMGAKNSGLGFASIGYKWRMLSTPSWELAMAANYDFLISHDLYRSNGPDDIEVLGLPLLVSHTHEDWTWYGQLGWHRVNDGTRFWDYGIAVSHPLGASTQFMMEVYGYSDSSFNSNELNYQLGLDFEVTPVFHLLTSAGSRIKSGFEPAYRLDYTFYIGLQWFTGG
ncbi:MAG: hypothetical protein OES90_04630 [Xanthomonadales bacterium]|nr:hypothetical protein [Xanthomonadales bacterium]